MLMKTLILAALGLNLAISAPVLAQYNHHQQPQRGARYSDPVARTLRDLQMVYSQARVDHHESNHFRRAIGELNDFQRDASRGRFDYGNLDRAIDNIKDLAQADQLHPRHRAILREDLFALRDFRNYAGRRW